MKFPLFLRALLLAYAFKFHKYVSAVFAYWHSDFSYSAVNFDVNVYSVFCFQRCDAVVQELEVCVFIGFSIQPKECFVAYFFNDKAAVPDLL